MQGGRRHSTAQQQPVLCWLPRSKNQTLKDASDVFICNPKRDPRTSTGAFVTLEPSAGPTDGYREKPCFSGTEEVVPTTMSFQMCFPSFPSLWHQGHTGGFARPLNWRGRGGWVRGNQPSAQELLWHITALSGVGRTAHKNTGHGVKAAHPDSCSGVYRQLTLPKATEVLRTEIQSSSKDWDLHAWLITRFIKVQWQQQH